ncbi:carbon starvation protein CstA [Shewanella sp. GXUN23E]|uniref:carbon starvation protein CstA n=1 Tax=Shewanella sp. GXUN23E TaxID=3422498 RepID=UPI003D7D68D3
MRTLQGFGLIFTLVALVLGYVLLAPIQHDTSASAASASGLALVYGVLPLLGLAALMLLPSSVALLSSNVRHYCYFRGRFWLGILAFNLVISAGYVLIAGYLAYLLWLG